MLHTTIGFLATSDDYISKSLKPYQSKVSCMSHKIKYAISKVCGSCINSLHMYFGAQVNTNRLQISGEYTNNVV